MDTYKFQQILNFMMFKMYLHIWRPSLHETGHSAAGLQGIALLPPLC